MVAQASTKAPVPAVTTIPEAPSAKRAPAEAGTVTAARSGDHSPKSARAVRLACGLTLIQAAVAGKSAEATMRLYEANREAVSDIKRAQLDRYYAGLKASLRVTNEAR